MSAAPSSRELFDLAWKRLKPRTQRDFWRDLGLDGAQANQRVDRIRDGAELHYDETWAMLRALGWIRTELSPLEQLEEFVRRLDAGERVTKQERERVARLVDRVEESVHLLAAKIREGAQVARKA